jgi:ribosomal-protein-serine acetyltransferase
MGLMFTAIVGPGVELRLLEERHAPALFALVDRERQYLRQWLSWVDTRSSEEDILGFIHDALELFASGKGFSAGIWADGAVAGVITLHKIDWRDRLGEIGYWLAREFQGRGIMTRAARGVTEHALVELDLHRVEIRCAVGNVKSSAIPKRLGFTFDGVLRQASHRNGSFLDLEVYSMLRSEYRRSSEVQS